MPYLEPSLPRPLLFLPPNGCAKDDNVSKALRTEHKDITYSLSRTDHAGVDSAHAVVELLGQSPAARDILFVRQSQTRLENCEAKQHTLV